MERLGKQCILGIDSVRSARILSCLVDRHLDDIHEMTCCIDDLSVREHIDHLADDLSSIWRCGRHRYALFVIPFLSASPHVQIDLRVRHALAMALSERWRPKAIHLNEEPLTQETLSMTPGEKRRLLKRYAREGRLLVVPDDPCEEAPSVPFHSFGVLGVVAFEDVLPIDEAPVDKNRLLGILKAGGVDVVDCASPDLPVRACRQLDAMYATKTLSVYAHRFLARYGERNFIVNLSAHKHEDGLYVHVSFIEMGEHENNEFVGVIFPVNSGLDLELTMHEIANDLRKQGVSYIFAHPVFYPGTDGHDILFPVDALPDASSAHHA